MSVEPTFEADWVLPGASGFQLASGATLPTLAQHYAVYGNLNAHCDNAILVCHALSGSARAADWWQEMFTEAFDLKRDCVICINVVGSCYGSTSPQTVNPRNGQAYGGDFPVITIQDMVRAQRLVIEALGIKRLHAVIGGSIGGMQAVGWALQAPQAVSRCIAIGCSALPAHGLALNHLQRQAIKQDARWAGGNYAPDKPPIEGLALARAIAMCSYKSPELFDKRYARQYNERAGENPFDSIDARFAVAGYLDYQGASFNHRFDANSYLTLTKAMDLFDPFATYQPDSFSNIAADTTLIGISTDQLFPPAHVQRFAKQIAALHIPTRYLEFESPHGHDGFLADAAKLAPIIRKLIKP